MAYQDTESMLNDLRVLYRNVPRPKAKIVKILAEQFQAQKISEDTFVSIASVYIRNNSEALGKSLKN